MLAVEQYRISADAFQFVGHQKTHSEITYLASFSRPDNLPRLKTGTDDSSENRKSPFNMWLVERLRANNRFLSSMVAPAVLVCLSIFAAPPPTFATMYTTPASPITHSSMLLTNEYKDRYEEYIEALDLKPATESQPQIKLPKSYQGGELIQNGRCPLLQGLVYFTEQQTLGSSYPPDYINDLLILTAHPIDSNDNRQDDVLAGAKIPISTVRFPFLFQMYKENLTMKNKRDIWFGTGEGGEQKDVIVEARICPKDSLQLPCSDGEMRRFARGIGKVVSGLPGLEEGQIVRAPASLPLQ